jgi:lipopolysaccharide/colanic/teichoic acid biosynthesis glycosyltransferase
MPSDNARRGEVFDRREKAQRMYKFRTMRVDAEKDTGPVISGRNDPRVTPVGRFLCNMSIVDPRSGIYHRTRFQLI